MKKKGIKKKTNPKDDGHVIFIDRLTDIHMEKDTNELPKKRKKCKNKD